MKDSRFKKGGTKAFLQKLSRGLMLPIALLPIAGLFLGLGAGIENIMLQNGAVLGDPGLLPAEILKTIGDVIFANLPVLFAIAVAIAFTEDAGVAALSAFIGWAVFNITQSTLIWEYVEVVDLTSGNILAEGLRRNLDINQIAADNGLDMYQVGTEIIYYQVLWFSHVPGSVIGRNIGIKSMQTSVFGGIAVGFLVAWIYNRWHTYQMPKILGFFSGTRLVPIMSFLLLPILGFMFLMTWPAIGIGLERLGGALAAAPTGLDAFGFGYIERVLIPFGLHHAFYTPLWYTSVGGSWYVVDGANNIVGEAFGNQSIWFAMVSQGVNFNVLDSATVVEGSNVAANIGDGRFYEIALNSGDIGYLTYGVSPGSYLQGKYPFMMFGLPAAGIAMIMAAQKERRQVAGSVIWAAILTVFLTGITEPLEFTFLFLAPWLFFGFHALMAGFSFMLLDIVGSNIGMTFSGGAFDIVLYGLIPDISGNGVDHWNIYWIGAIYIPIYYLVFYYGITKLDIETPGRTKDGGDALLSKDDYKELKEAEKEFAKRKEELHKHSVKGVHLGEDAQAELSEREKKDEEVDRKVREAQKPKFPADAFKPSKSGPPSKERVELLLYNLGGMENLESIDACITRLRLTVKDRKLVIDPGLMDMGAVGIVGKGSAIQVIFGAEADAFKVQLLKLRKK